MVLPIVTALSREVFAQTPVTHKEGALALGRHQVGDDPHRGAAVRPPRRHLRLDAGSRPRARRDHRRHHHRVAPWPTATAWSWSLLNGGETFASRIANNAAEFDSPAEGRRLHRRRAWCCSSSPSSSTRSPASSSSAGRPSPNERPRHQRLGSSRGPAPPARPPPARARPPRPRTRRSRTCSPGSSCGRPSCGARARWPGSCGRVVSQGYHLLLQAAVVDQLPEGHHRPPTSAAARSTRSRARSSRASSPP